MELDDDALLFPYSPIFFLLDLEFWYGISLLGFKSCAGGSNQSSVGSLESHRK